MRTALLLLAACAPTDQGFDRTVVNGTVTIPPAFVDDGRANEEVASPQALGVDESPALSWRTVVVNGRVTSWPAGLDPDGDADNFSFVPAADGTWTFTLAFTTESLSGDSGDTAAVQDADVIALQVIDPASYDEDAGTGVLCELESVAGAVALECDVTANTAYVLRVLPRSTDAPDDPLDYTLVVPGSTPDDTTILVGAYPGSDPTARENPLGGTNATGWTYDPATYTWSGSWRMMWLRTVTPAEPDTDTGDKVAPAPTVKEGAEQAFVRAGSLLSLNDGLSAGTLYSTVAVEIEAKDAEYTLETPLVLDGVAPKVIGIVTAETLPDETLAEVDDATGVLDTSTLVAQEIGMLSGLGYVDVITGSTTFDPAYVGWNNGNDSDAYGFTVPEPMYVRMVTRWPGGTDVDIDIGIFFDDPDYGFTDLMTYSAEYCMTGANPEVCTSVITLEPEIPYYVVPLGYAGTDETAYTIELEWIAP